MRRVGLLLVIAAVGCGIDPEPELSYESGDPAVYAAELHPMIEARCATLDCHGDPGRPLRLYAETGLRARDELRDAPMTDQELAANTDALFGVDPFAPGVDESLLLLEPLAVDAGGVHHEGGDVWKSRDDPGYLCVRSFLAGIVDRRACAEARERDALPPEL